MTVYANDAATVIQAFERAGLTPSTPAQRLAQGVGMLETRCGRGWSGAGVGSFNWGAVQAGSSSWTGATFEYVDTHPNPDGTSTTYRAKFRKYPDNLSGCLDFLRILYVKRPTVLAAAQSGDSGGVSSALYATRYYEGFGATPADRVRNHHKALERMLKSIDAALVPPDPRKPTLRRGSGYQDEQVRDFVREWQRHLKTTADGLFGPTTEGLTKNAQRVAGLKVDGIVGPVTWALVEE
jgi:hypothetical protein